MDYHSVNMYEAANEIFDEVVFTDEKLLEAYNGILGDIAREELFDVVGFMTHDATEAMRNTAEKHRRQFVRLIESEQEEA